MSDIPKTWQELKQRFEDAPKPENVRSFCICGKCEPQMLTDEDYQGMFTLLYGSDKMSINWDDTTIDDELYIGTSETVVNKRANRSLKKDTPMT